MWPRWRRWLRILGWLGLNWISKSPFKSREKRWRWWRATDTCVFTLTTDWTGNVTLRLSTRRVRADSTVCRKMVRIFYQTVAPAVGCWEKNVAQTAQHNGQHFTSPAWPTGQTAECFQLEAPSTAVIRTAKGSHSCPQQKQYIIMTPLCAGRGGLSSECQCTMHILHLICTVRATVIYLSTYLSIYLSIYPSDIYSTSVYRLRLSSVVIISDSAFYETQNTSYTLM